MNKLDFSNLWEKPRDHDIRTRLVLVRDAKKPPAGSTGGRQPYQASDLLLLSRLFGLGRALALLAFAAGARFAGAFLALAAARAGRRGGFICGLAAGVG